MCEETAPRRAGGNSYETLSNLGHEQQEMGTSKSCLGSKMGPERQINQSLCVDPCQECHGRKAGRLLQINTINPDGQVPECLKGNCTRLGNTT